MKAPLRPSGGRGRGPSRQRWEGEVGARRMLWNPPLLTPAVSAVQGRKGVNAQAWRTMTTPDYLLGDRPGHDEHARDPVRCRRRHPSHGAGRARGRSTRVRAGSSTIRRRSGGPSSRPAARRSPPRGVARSPRSASPTSAKPRCSGNAAPDGRCTTRSSGRTAAPPRCAKAGARPGSPSRWQAAPGSSSTRISRPRRSAGCSTRWPVCAGAPPPARSCSARSTASSRGV